MRARSALTAQAGMTLVEVLLVIFIVGLVAGLAVMTLPARESVADKAVRSVRTAIQDAHDRAIMTGEVVALRPSRSGLEVLQWTGHDWAQLRQPAIRLPEDMTLRLMSADTGDEAALLVFNPLGEIAPVRINVQRGIESRQLDLTPDGEVVDAQAG